MLRRACFSLAALWLAACGTDPSTLQEQLCAEIACGAGRCVLDDGLATCLCDQGYRAESLTCVQTNPCEPDVCAGGVRSVCNAVEGEAVCSCPAGHAPVGETSCSAQAVFDCAAQPAGGGGDYAEPDSCPSLAKGLVLGSVELRSLTPAGDTDWIALGTQPGHVYQLTTHSGTGLVIDVLSADGFRTLAFDHLGGPEATLLFRADDPAGHVVRIAAATASAVGDYNIQLLHLGVDDFPDTVAAASVVTVGTSLLGSLESVGDLDVVKVQLEAGISYQLGVSASGPAASSLLVELLSTDGTQVLRRASGNPARVHPLLGSAGTYALRVKSTTGQAVGEYTLDLRNLGADDHGDSYNEATVLAPEQVANGTLQRATDVDAFTIDAREGLTYVASCQTSYSSCRLRALDSDGTLLGTSAESSWSAELAVKAPRNGRLSFELSGGTANGTYTVVISQQGADDHGDTSAAATAISLSTTATSAALLHHGDVDVFAFPVVAGRAYRFHCTTSYQVTCDVTVKSAAGEEWAHTIGSYYSLVVAGFEAPASGTAYAFVRAAGFGRGGYTFRLEDAGIDDHGDNLGAATALTPGAPALGGALELSGDVDAFAFDALAGHAYRVTCTSSGVQCLLQLRSPAGGVLTSNAHQRTISNGLQLAYETTAAGRYTLEVFSTTSSGGTGFGSYSLTLEDLGVDDHGNDSAHATALAVDAEGTGLLSTFQDVDVFRLTVPAGHVVRFSCAITEGTGSCPLQLKNASDTLIESRSGSVSYEAGTSDATTYVVVTRDYYASALYPYAYTVEDLGADDHSDGVIGATALTVGADPLTGSLETANDLDVFSVSLTAGRIYRFECVTETSYSCTLRQRSAAGGLLRETNQVLELEASETVTNFIEVAASQGFRGTYTLRAIDLGPDDHGDGASAATKLTLGTPLSGVLEFGADVDAFYVTLEAGRTYQLATTVGTVYASLLGPDGATIGYDSYLDTYGRNFTTTAVAGNYVVLVRRYSSGAGYSSYALVVR